MSTKTVLGGRTMAACSIRDVALGFVAPLMVAFVSPAAAQPGQDMRDMPGRFTMSPVEGGFLRLDRDTGAVSMCAKSGSDWACKAIDDPLGGSDIGVARLQSENRDLRRRLKELEDELSSGPPPPPLSVKPGPDAPAPELAPKAQLPTDAEVDQALDYLSRVYKKVREHIRDLDKPITPNEHSPPPLLTPEPPGSPPPSPPPGPAPKGAL
jgi:hypothetical protein